MLFILGLLSFFQLVFIPGFVVLKFTGLDTGGKIRALVYIFTLSLLVNYLLVFLLTALKAYTPAAVYGFMLMEAVLLGWYYWKKARGGNALRFDPGAPLRGFKELTQSRSVFFNVCFVLALAAMALLFYYYLSRIKAVFYFNDAVLGWNKFAKEWHAGGFPTNTWLYPQLMASNWSLSYVIMQTADVQFIARNVNALFPILNGLLFLDLGLKKKNGVYFLGCVFYVLMVSHLYNPGMLMGGFMDIPVAFFCFLAFYELHGGDGKTFNLQRAIMSVVFACAAAVTKQPGFYILAVVLAWNTGLMIKHRQALGAKKMIKTAGVFLLLVIILVGSWYGFRMVLINEGVESSGVAAVTQKVHQNRTSAERWEHGFNRILRVGGKNNDLARLLIHLAIFFIIMGVFPKKSRYVVLFMVVPYTLMWGYWFSYDYRNLTAAFPFMAFSMAFGGQWFFSRLNGGIQKIKAKDVSIWKVAALVLAVVLILNFTVFKSDRILDNQLKQQHNLGDKGLNKKLYEYYEKHGFEGKVYSKYPYFRHLPVLRDYWVPERDAEGVVYLLENLFRPNRDIVKEVKQKIRSGHYKILFKHLHYRFLKIKKNTSKQNVGQ